MSPVATPTSTMLAITKGMQSSSVASAKAQSAASTNCLR